MEYKEKVSAEPQEPIWSIAGRIDPEKLMEYWVTNLPSYPLDRPLPLSYLRGHLTYMLEHPDAAIPTPSIIVPHTNTRQQSSFQRTPPVDNIYDQTPESIPEAARKLVTNAHRSLHARNQLIPHMLHYAVDAKNAFYILNINWLQHVPAIAGMLRNVDVYERGPNGELLFFHPSADILPSITDELFTLADKVFSPTGTQANTFKDNHDILQALTNFEMLAKLYHIPLDGSGRTVEDFYLFLAGRVNGYTPPNISVTPYRNEGIDGPLRYRMLLEGKIKQEFLGNVSALLGLYTYEHNLQGLQERAIWDYGIYHILHVGQLYTLQEMLRLMQQDPTAPITPTFAYAAQSLEDFRAKTAYRTYDDIARIVNVDYLQGCFLILSETDEPSTTLLRRIGSIAQKLYERNTENRDILDLLFASYHALIKYWDFTNEGDRTRIAQQSLDTITYILEKGDLSPSMQEDFAKLYRSFRWYRRK